MLTNIPSVLTSITAALDIGKAALAQHDARQAGDAVAHLTKQLTQAHVCIIELCATIHLKDDLLAACQKENQQLVMELEEMKTADLQFADYELCAVAAGSTFVYAPKADPDGNRRPPYLCPSCYHQGKRSILHFQKANRAHPATSLVCPASAGHALALRGGWTAQNIGLARPDA